jgi:hypothetical protein
MCAGVHAEAPPVGLVAVRTSPLPSVATHKVAVGQSMLFRSAPAWTAPVGLSIRATFHVGEAAAGSDVVARSPLESVATHSALDGQSTPVKSSGAPVLGSTGETDTHRRPATDGAAELSSCDPDAPTHKEAVGHDSDDTAAPAIRADALQLIGPAACAEPTDPHPHPTTAAMTHPHTFIRAGGDLSPHIPSRLTSTLTATAIQSYDPAGTIHPAGLSRLQRPLHLRTSGGGSAIETSSRNR